MKTTRFMYSKLYISNNVTVLYSVPVLTDVVFVDVMRSHRKLLNLHFIFCLNAFSPFLNQSELYTPVREDKMKESSMPEKSKRLRLSFSYSLYLSILFRSSEPQICTEVINGLELFKSTLTA